MADGNRRRESEDDLQLPEHAPQPRQEKWNQDIPERLTSMDQIIRFTKRLFQTQQSEIVVNAEILFECVVDSKIIVGVSFHIGDEHFLIDLKVLFSQFTYNRHENILPLRVIITRSWCLSPQIEIYLDLVQVNFKPISKKFYNKLKETMKGNK